MEFRQKAIGSALDLISMLSRAGECRRDFKAWNRREHKADEWD